MKSTDSIWKDECPSSQTYPALTQHTETDVVIVGGGISGITAAYMLAKKGKKVVLLEKNNIGDGVTGYTTAFITYVIDKPLVDIAAALGKTDAQKIWQAGKNGIDFIERVIDEEKIQCEFMRCSASIYAPDQKGADRLKKEAVLARELGFDADFRTDNELPIPHKGYIVIHNQAKFMPLLYVRGLAAAAVKAGVKIYEHTNADEVQEKESITVRCGDVNVYAEHAIMATQYPFGGPLTMAAKLLPYNSYVITATIPAGIIAEGLYWDTETPYHYVRVDKKNKYDRLIIGGEDHKTGQTPQGRSPYAELEKYMRSILGGANYTITNAWSSQVLNTVDGLPYIGAMPFTHKQLLATGYNGTGMAYSTVAALINTDIILGVTNQDTTLYSPSRLKGLTHMIGHTADSFAQFFKGMTAKRDHNAEIKPDEGKIVEVNGKKIAIYRDAQGKVIKLSPVCTHLGCIVQWNGNEKTWDCPCHGSRFDATGNVIEGPAQKPLPRMDDH